MTRCCRFLALLLLLTAAVQSTHAQEFAKPLDRLDLQDGDSIVFLGDSITHQRLYTQYVEDFFYTRYPKMRLKLHNAGVGGARAWDALARFDQDVAAYKPKYVTILLGMNDGSYQPYNEEIFQTYRQDMTELLTQIQAIGATPILMTPTMFDARAKRMKDNPNRPTPEATRELYNSVLTYYGTWLRDVAQREGFGFVDMWGPLNNITIVERKTDPTFTMITDAVHPDAPGQVVMAAAMIEDLGLKGPVSNIRVFTAPNGEPKATGGGGKVTGLEMADDRVAFTFAANSLPWVLPEEAALGVKLTKLGHRLSAERLQVLGLRPGKYRLSIDGENVGEYQANALAGRIELQANEKTPQYQQALKVAQLNKQRNEGPIRELRGEWSLFQRYARAKRAADGSPDNEELAKQATALAGQIAGIEDRVAAANAAAKQIEDQIFEVNTPQPRQYVIERVQ
jgi:lysophospholipase L1-like esterase